MLLLLLLRSDITHSGILAAVFGNCGNGGSGLLSYRVPQSHVALARRKQRPLDDGRHQSQKSWVGPLDGDDGSAGAVRRPPRPMTHVCHAWLRQRRTDALQHPQLVDVRDAHDHGLNAADMRLAFAVSRSLALSGAATADDRVVGSARSTYAQTQAYAHYARVRDGRRSRQVCLQRRQAEGLVELARRW